MRFGGINIDSHALVFGLGLLAGSLIGTSGIIIISVLLACYYFRDTIAHRHTHHEINLNQTSGTESGYRHSDIEVSEDPVVSSHLQGLLTSISGWINNASAELKLNQG